ncbi:MAG: hypothetical protein HFF44_02885 [Lawsonibacter sp.]|nr:hypothetical protein [Lawsonibacter sp.]
MGFRITTNMMMSTYRYNLMNSTNKLSDSVEKVQTKRNFNSYAEDPASATQAFRLRREFYQTYSQTSNTKDVYNKFNTAWQNVQGMLDDLINPMEKISAIRGNNDTTGEARRALAQVLRETSESMIQGFNQQLGDHFIFAGNDGLNVPFEWKGEDLYYRGINVNSGNVKKPTAPEPAWMTSWKGDIDNLNAYIDANPTDPNIDALIAQRDSAQSWYDYYNHEGEKPDDGLADDHYLDALLGGDASTATGKDAEWVQYYLHETKEPPIAEEPGWATSGDPAADKYGVPTDMPVVGSDEVEQGWINYYRDQGNLAKLKEMCGEEMYIDLGMGAAENGPNNPVRGSYFNSALSGLDYTGFGVDETDEFGDPKNMAILMRQLADVLDTWDENADPQGYNPDLAKNSAAGLSADELEAKAFRLMDKLKIAQEDLTAKHVELNAQSAFLKTNQQRLELQSTNLNSEILDIEQVDLADALTALSWDQMCYNAALKIGTQLLSQSLLDYMR